MTSAELLVPVSRQLIFLIKLWKRMMVSLNFDFQLFLAGIIFSYMRESADF